MFVFPRMFAAEACYLLRALTGTVYFLFLLWLRNPGKGIFHTTPGFIEKE
jgi:hypothetical protein